MRYLISRDGVVPHIAYWQGEGARYLTLRKNLFDLRRMAVVHNLHVLARLYESAQDAVA